MADSKKYNGSTWEHSLRKLATATDTFTTLPVDVYADGNNATVGISGNTVQNGIPTPSNPIMPQGTGERTENLFDKNTTVYGEYINEDGTITHEDIEKTAWLSDYIPVTAGLTYTLNKTGSRRGKFYKADKTPYQTATMDFSGLENKNTFIIPETVAYIRFTIYKGVTSPDDIMLNLGSTALPYEPYGYKLDISSGNTTNPVYLGEVETTRKIKKLVLDGTENYGEFGGNTWLALGTLVKDFRGTAEGAICSHLPLVLRSNFTTNTCAWGGGQIGDFLINIDNKNTTDLKSYLAQQYANGTPVTVWYVLATPQTAVVNEPLMRIGDYADTVSGITIPTVTGKDTFDVLTTLKPSEVELTYTGWHDATVKEWDGSQWD